MAAVIGEQKILIALESFTRIVNLSAIAKSIRQNLSS